MRQTKADAAWRKPYIPPTEESIIASLPVAEHLGLTPENLVEVCRELWDCDPVIQRHKDRIAEQEAAIKNYDDREQEFRTLVNNYEAEIDSLTARMKELDTMRREARGQAVSYKFHAKLAFNRIREAGTAITKRRKQLYLFEAQRRLRALGKQLKISKGQRALAGKPTAVVPIDDPTA